MSFTSDLIRIIREQFDKNGIRYEKSMQARKLAASYLQMLNRRISSRPRRVHFSEQLSESLGRLKREADTNQQKKAAEAWSAVFRIRHMMVRGENVNAFLTKRIDSATGSRSRDGMLWDFGMHHLHLGIRQGRSRFVERSPYLLFAILTEDDAYFVDVRPHPTRNSLGWVRQDLLRIVQAHWPEMIEPRILRGTKGAVLTDQERATLRRRNVNVATDLDGHSVGPLGGGVAADGSSILCTVLADQLMDEITRHQEFFDTQPPELRLALQKQGMATAGEMECDLVLLEEQDLSRGVLDSLAEDSCLSKRLSQLGFAVVERTTRCLIAVNCVGEE